MYLVRFVVGQDYGEDSTSSDTADVQEVFSDDQSVQRITGTSSAPVRKAGAPEPKANYFSFSVTTQFPPSVSIATLLEVGKLVKPVAKTKLLLTFEQFDIASKQWRDAMEIECTVDSEKFSSGGFRDAYHWKLTGKSANRNIANHWVIKTYNEKSKEAIGTQFNTSIESHSRKQVQMHEVARHLTKKFKAKAPKEMGECFQYNHVYYTTINDQPATVEEFVPGRFAKLINNDGRRAKLPDDADDELKDLLAKAECLIHYTYASSNQQLMLLDIQGSGYCLYDPEIATNNTMDANSMEFYFCCGNCSSVGITGFLNEHECNDYCKVMGLSQS